MMQLDYNYQYIDKIRSKIEGLDKNKELAYWYVLGNILIRKYMSVTSTYIVTDDTYKRELSILARKIKSYFIINIKEAELTELFINLFEANISYLDISTIPSKINKKQVLHHFIFGIRESVSSDIKNIIKENESDIKSLVTYFVPWLNENMKLN